MVEIPLACLGCFVGANAHKLLIAAVGLSCLIAAWRVRASRRNYVARGSGFEVLP